MANCLMSLKGITYDCGSNLAGVKEIWVNDYRNVEVDYSDTTDGTVSIILKQIDNSPAPKFLPIEFAKNTASFTSTLTKDETKGTKYYTTELVANINKMTIGKNMAFSGYNNGDISESGLDAGQLIVLVKDKNDKIWVLGAEDYAYTSALTGQSGAVVDDGNFYTWTVTSQSPRLPYTLVYETFEGLINTNPDMNDIA